MLGLSPIRELLLISELSRYSSDLVKRSIHACGLGIALALFLDYKDEVVQAIGLGCLLHEYGYLIDPVKHANAGAMNLEMNFFTSQNKYTSIALNIIEYHHTPRPHRSAHVNCGKIAIHWCSNVHWDTSTRMQAIRARRLFYSDDIFEGFTRLYELMRARKEN